MKIERAQLINLLDTMMEYQKSLIDKGGMSRQSWELLDRVEESIKETKDRRNDMAIQRWALEHSAYVEPCGGR